jgi:hypothetical protein
MSEEETIHVEDEPTGDQEQASKEQVWSEEFKVAGEELLETVKTLMHEAGIRRLIIKNREGRVLLEVPLFLGVAGIAMFGWWSAVALIAALVTECTILVERVEKQPDPAE